MQRLALSFLTVACAFTSLPAHAAYTVQINEVGPDVIARGSGSLDLTNLVKDQFPDATTNAFIQAQGGSFALGAGSGNEAIYFGVVGPSAFGTGSFHAATAASGSYVQLRSNGAGGSHVLVLSPSYVSGSVLPVNVDTFAGQSFASLGLAPGSYVYSLGSVGSDTLTIDIGEVAAVPEPAIWVMMVAGFGVLGGLLRRRHARPTLPLFARLRSRHGRL